MAGEQVDRCPVGVPRQSEAAGLRLNPRRPEFPGRDDDFEDALVRLEGSVRRAEAPGSPTGTAWDLRRERSADQLGAQASAGRETHVPQGGRRAEIKATPVRKADEDSSVGFHRLDPLPRVEPRAGDGRLAVLSRS